ncbi:hypothetical protein [Ruegeria arenilitoris]|uniref:hypothetical protein n=1 Tax=Ruegeria arenilitoris TaxID=1173585 RepID=UPI001480513F|nr:hypothetical protein [Ruegeria arenilitoris]
MKIAAKKIGAVACVLVVASGAQAQDFMSQKELLATIPGATVRSVSNQDNKTPWVQAYSSGRKKGKLAGNFGGDTYDGEWYVDGDAWCEKTGDWTGCFQFVRISEKELQPYKDGRPRKHTWKLE